ncbi:MAG: acyl-CoA thioesterase [Euryarchaeota archaeon]|nr:acyl-CoA thioesterase [Euryarchaeota archaeon]
MAHVERMRVSYRDIDMMDHVNNAAYFTYFETVRCHYYEALTGLKEINRLDIIVAKQSCQYLRGLRYDEEFDAVAWPSRIGTTSFTLAYVLRTVRGETVALGETVIVMFDYAKNAKKPIPATLRAKLERDLAKGPGVTLPA